MSKAQNVPFDKLLPFLQILAVIRRSASRPCSSQPGTDVKWLSDLSSLCHSTSDNKLIVQAQCFRNRDCCILAQSTADRLIGGIV